MVRLLTLIAALFAVGALVYAQQADARKKATQQTAPSSETQIEQKSGEPLYLPPKEYESDLAPETDPYWKEEKKRYEQTGEDPHDEPAETYYERREYKRPKR